MHEGYFSKLVLIVLSTGGCIIVPLWLLHVVQWQWSAVLFLAGASPLQVELGANLFVYISLVTCEYLSLLLSYGIFLIM